ncbi:hypothetical protein TEQG_02817 [Trichophyton equinum CBS 127.97]|uniref:Uncharacterized protein n=1 Tax=Trichophyton equinum (strain ATCC MYA-4606 / CBS 127.97) TaxID=559882 RepID=F2PPG5_TRIEC|nr:hypothetical protein TEQG_02817 [Trichophyton equinum CBS 127.97]
MMTTTTAKMKMKTKITMQPTKREVGCPPFLGPPDEAQRSQAKLADQSEAAEPRERTNVLKLPLKGLNVGIRAVTLDRHGTSTSMSTGSKGQDVMCTKHSHAVCGEEQGRFVLHDW